jgi:predicted nuclease of predicted toxin-antitoxin system
MKILLDENITKKLSLNLPGHNVSNVEEEGWRSIKNGELLRLMVASEFEVLITRDTSLCSQQNIGKYSIPIVVLRGNNLSQKDILQFSPLIIKLLKGRLKPGPHELTLN